jgi:hypothetical protein
MAFTFHANTLAFGGQIEQQGTRKNLVSQASVALPPTGGFGEASTGRVVQEDISFDSSRSTVTSSESVDKDGNTTYFTFANVSVYQLDIGGRIQVAVLNSTVTSRNYRERENDCAGESSISVGGEIVGLVIDGQAIDVDFDPEPFRRHGKFGEFVDSFTTMPKEKVKAFAEASNWPLAECETEVEENGVTTKKYHVPRRCTTGIRASMLRSTTPQLTPGEIPGITRKGFTIEVARFGLIHLGEVLLKAGRRRINLMRVELNKTLDGSPMVRAALPDSGGEPRLVTAAFSAASEPFALVGASGGGYTFASGEGNGTDFIP